ncbi:suppressor of fused domain protein [Actinoplanes sp. NPDC020271]|uniref:suppressor of fused domain protein n=1 Tax=Actinoplanes sp. NPDC020271 TaxID=3363896 RepID=UPI0037A785F7
MTQQHPIPVPKKPRNNPGATSALSEDRHRRSLPHGGPHDRPPLTHGLEFVLAAPTSDDEIHVETLTMIAYYHATGGDYALDHGHTVPIGRPWLPGSPCDHLLVSLPYPWGPELEHCDVPGGHARVLWLLPITGAEKRFRHSDGLEALEQRFEAAGIIPTDPYREAVVADMS